MHPDQIEEMNYFPQSDLQNALTISKSKLSTDNSVIQGKIDALVLAGKYVVIGQGECYCEYTDAYVGSGLGIFGVYDRLHDAIQHYRDLNTDENDIEGRFFGLKVLPWR